MWTKAGLTRLGTMVCVGAAAMAMTAGAAVAGPVPRPPAQKQAGHTGHTRTAHHRPHTVVRCQNDDTEQIDEFGDDGDEPQHSFTPIQAAPGGRCSRDALGIARTLAGDRARPRTARPVR